MEGVGDWRRYDENNPGAGYGVEQHALGLQRESRGSMVWATAGRTIAAGPRLKEVGEDGVTAT